MTTIKKAANKFYMGDDVKEPMAEMTFVTTGESILVIDHTYVSDELRGQGVARKLLDAVVNHAREKGMQIKPVCTFAKKQLESAAEYEDILIKD